MSSVLAVDPKNPDHRVIMRAVEVIRSGGLVVYPTDTVYGLGADALNHSAVLKVFKAKNRRQSQPLPVAVSGLRMAEDLAHIVEEAHELINAFWPGGLTIVLNKKPRTPFLVTGGGRGVGLRAPKHRVPLSIIQVLGGPITATSANIHGEPPCIRVEDVLGIFKNDVDLIIDGGVCDGGVSTVIDLLNDTPIIRRQGVITKERLRAVIGSI